MTPPTTLLQTTGEYPAIRGFDINNTRAAGQCVAHWGQGGLCMFGYHMGLIGGDGYQGSMTKAARERWHSVKVTTCSATAAPKGCFPPSTSTDLLG